MKPSKQNVAEIIRTLFPRPSIKPPPYPDGTYCVGGAVILYRELLRGGRPENVPIDRRYPGDFQLADVLQSLNSRLDYDTAFFAANEIIEYNDAGDFDAAFDTLDAAINYGRCDSTA